MLKIYNRICCFIYPIKKHNRCLRHCSFFSNHCSFFSNHCLFFSNHCLFFNSCLKHKLKYVIVFVFVRNHRIYSSQCYILVVCFFSIIVLYTNSYIRHNKVSLYFLVVIIIWHLLLYKCIFIHLTSLFIVIYFIRIHYHFWQFEITIMIYYHLPCKNRRNRIGIFFIDKHIVTNIFTIICHWKMCPWSANFYKKALLRNNFPYQFSISDYHNSCFYSCSYSILDSIDLHLYCNLHFIIFVFFCL